MGSPVEGVGDAEVRSPHPSGVADLRKITEPIVSLLR
jgi:hypothetical protein